MHISPVAQTPGQGSHAGRSGTAWEQEPQIWWSSRSSCRLCARLIYADLDAECHSPRRDAGGYVLSCHLVRCCSGLPASTSSEQRGQITTRCSVAPSSAPALPGPTTRSAAHAAGTSRARRCLSQVRPGTSRITQASSSLCPLSATSATPSGRMRMCAFYSRSWSSSAADQAGSLPPGAGHHRHAAGGTCTRST